MKKVVYRLPEGDYMPDFIQILAMASYLEILEPEELSSWLDKKKSHEEIGFILGSRIKENRK